MRHYQEPRSQSVRAGVSANSELTLAVDHLMNARQVAERTAIGTARRSLE